MREPIWTRDRLRRLVNREIGDYRIIVVSNRQPYVHELVEGDLRVSTPAGGVTTAIDPLMQECAGTWIAHGGGAGDYPGGRRKEPGSWYLRRTLPTPSASYG